VLISIAVVTIVIVLLAGLWALHLRSDMKFLIWRQPDQAVSGTFSATAEAVVDSTMNHALSTTKDAMKRIGADDPRIDFEAHSVTGWVGSNVNWAESAEYQIVVSFRRDSDGRLIVNCRSRPRHRLAFSVWGNTRQRSYQHVQTLTSEIVARPSPP
jgi:hypothetical protein